MDRRGIEDLQERQVFQETTEDQVNQGPEVHLVPRGVLVLTESWEIQGPRLSRRLSFPETLGTREIPVHKALRVHRASQERTDLREVQDPLDLEVFLGLLVWTAIRVHPALRDHLGHRVKPVFVPLIVLRMEASSLSMDPSPVKAIRTISMDKEGDRFRSLQRPSDFYQFLPCSFKRLWEDFISPLSRCTPPSRLQLFYFYTASILINSFLFLFLNICLFVFSLRPVC